MKRAGRKCLSHRKDRSTAPAFLFSRAIKNRRRRKDEGVVSYARSCAVDCAKGRMTMLDRRDFMKACSGMGLAGTLFPGVLWAQAQAESAKKITKEMIENSAAVTGVSIADENKEMMLEDLN